MSKYEQVAKVVLLLAVLAWCCLALKRSDENPTKCILLQSSCFFCPIFIAGDLGQDWLRAFFNNDYDEMEALQTEALAEARHHVAS